MWEHQHSDDSCTHNNVFGQTWIQKYKRWIISVHVRNRQKPACKSKWWKDYFFLMLFFYISFCLVFVFQLSSSAILWEWNATHHEPLLLLIWKLSHLLLPVFAECYSITRLPKVAKRSTLFITIEVRGWGIEEPTTLKEDQ